MKYSSARKDEWNSTIWKSYHFFYFVKLSFIWSGNCVICIKVRQQRDICIYPFLPKLPSIQASITPGQKSWSFVTRGPTFTGLWTCQLCGKLWHSQVGSFLWASLPLGLVWELGMEQEAHGGHPAESEQWNSWAQDQTDLVFRSYTTCHYMTIGKSPFLSGLQVSHLSSRSNTSFSHLYSGIRWDTDGSSAFVATTVSFPCTSSSKESLLKDPQSHVSYCFDHRHSAHQHTKLWGRKEVAQEVLLLLLACPYQKPRAIFQNRLFVSNSLRIKTKFLLFFLICCLIGGKLLLMLCHFNGCLA